LEPEIAFPSLREAEDKLSLMKKRPVFSSRVQSWPLLASDHIMGLTTVGASLERVDK
jgi:hypothetical protein